VSVNSDPDDAEERRREARYRSAVAGSCVPDGVADELPPWFGLLIAVLFSVAFAAVLAWDVINTGGGLSWALLGVVAIGGPLLIARERRRYRRAKDLG
jgi:ABC-type uncharacterized transport system permease subunit